MQFHFFGPVLFYDMVRTARRGSYVLMRFIYAIITFTLLFLIYTSYFAYRDLESLKPSETTAFAEAFFNWFMILQYVLVLLLTPAYVASAIAEEKDRRTLEFIFATDLRNQEIVLSKLVSRMANLVLFLLAGLPILSMIQLFGGVNPRMLYGGFISTACTLFSVAAVTMLLSVYAKRTRDAISLSYLLIIGYYLSNFLFAWYMGATEQLVFMRRNFAEAGMVELATAWVFELYSAGNLVISLIRLSNVRINTIVDLGSSFADILRNYTLFHVIVGTLCTLWAIVRLRAVYRKQNFGAAVKQDGRSKGKRRRPIGDKPILWKELFLSTRMTRLGKLLYALFVLGSLAPLGIICYILLNQSHIYEERFWENFREAVNYYVRIVGTLVACLLILAVVLRAAGMITHERDKQTLDCLLTSRLSLREILIQKWWGSVLGVRPMSYLLFMIWFIGWVTGGLHWSTILFLPCCTLLYMMFFAALGLAFSAKATTSLRAMMTSLGWTIFLGGGHWFVCALPVLFMARWASETQYIAMFFTGFTPPAVIAWMSFSYEDVERWLSDYRYGEFEFFGFCALGLFVTLLFIFILLDWAERRFGQSVDRPKRPGGMAMPPQSHRIEPE